jgi:hypothetical protein
MNSIVFKGKKPLITNNMTYSKKFYVCDYILKMNYRIENSKMVLDVMCGLLIVGSHSNEHLKRL